MRLPRSEESLRELVAGRPVETTVKGSLLIAHTPKGFPPQEYSLRNIPGIAPHMSVYVCVNPFEAPAVNVTVRLPGRDEATYTVQPVSKNAAGFPVDAPVIGEEFKSHKDTAADKALKEIAKIAYAAPTLEAAEAAKKAGVKPFAHINVMADVEQTKSRVYLPRRGRDLTTPQSAREIPPLTPFAAALRLKPLLEEQGVEWLPEDLEDLKKRFPEGVPVDALDGLAGEFLARAERKKRESALRLVSGGL